MDIASKQGVPRYLQLAEELRQAIQSGKLTPATPFPTELDLCREYGVSRFTVREALRCLQDERLISRRRGSGTVVEPPHVQANPTFQSLTSLDEMRQYARDARSALVPMGEKMLPGAIARLIGPHGKTDRKWAFLHGVRTKGGGQDQPVAAIDCYIRSDLAHLVPQLDLTSLALFSQLETLGGLKIGRVMQQISAVPASAPMAKALQIPRRRPCLRILRIYHDSDGRPFEITNTYHPGEAFSYSMVIDPE